MASWTSIWPVAISSAFRYVCAAILIGRRGVLLGPRSFALRPAQGEPSKRSLVDYNFNPTSHGSATKRAVQLKPKVIPIKHMDKFDDIRPYNDDEVRPVLDRVLNDHDFRRAIARLRYPKLAKLLPTSVGMVVGWYIKRELRDAHTVADMQEVVQKYMERMMGQTMKGLTSSGLDKLDAQQAHLFVSNHRDIAMDPAFVDWVLHMNKQDTVRIAIGDNLLTMPFASDVMRLNKSFIVNRSAKGNKAKFKALKHLSEYLHYSITVDNAACWIAQRQGRAKDGRDRTETALMKMFAMNRPKEQPFADYIRELNIVPVSISYEWDPCDAAKARERYHQAMFGEYQKGEHEDVFTLAQGIAGVKGHVHLAFGDQLTGDFNNAEELAAEIDRQVIGNYVLQPSNCFAYKAIYGEVPEVLVRSEGIPFREEDFQQERRMFARRLRAIEPKYRGLVREMYANPIVSKLQWQALAQSSEQGPEQNSEHSPEHSPEQSGHCQPQSNIERQ